MGTRLTVFNQKGGVGKTTTVLNLGAALARRGGTPLLVDLDAQSHLSSILNPLAILGRWLEEQKLATPDDLIRITDEARAEVEAGRQFALDAPFPDASQVTEDLYA